LIGDQEAGRKVPVRRIGVQERRARLGVRHHLATARATSVAAVAESLVALHSTDPASVFLAVQARTGLDVRAIDRELYEDRSVIRMLGMRRTMFVLPVGTAPMVQAACTDAIATVQRRMYTKLLVEAGVGDGAWLADVEQATLQALAARGEATGAQLSTDEPRLRTSISLNEGKAYGGSQNITTWVLFMLAAEGRIVRGRPRGTWTSSQYHWSPTASWLPGGIAGLPAETAQIELVRRWLAAFGPGTLADLKWWTGLNMGPIKQAVAALGAVEVDLDGATGLVLPGDEEPVRDPKPWVALLPALDPTAMGWAQRTWYVGGHSAPLFDRSGNIGPTVWSDGRIVGGWAQRAGGDVVYRLLEDVGAEKVAAVEKAARRLETWIGSVRVTPRFRTPLERDLSA
jgi:hypothetical protein